MAEERRPSKSVIVATSAQTAPKGMTSKENPDKEGVEELRNAASAFDFLRFTVCDMHGIARSKTIPQRNIAKYVVEGVSFVYIFHGKRAQRFYFGMGVPIKACQAFKVVCRSLCPYTRMTNVLSAVVCFGTRSEIPEFGKNVNELPFPNAMAFPEPGTLRPASWLGEDKYTVGDVLCEMHSASDGAYEVFQPRFVARKQLESLRELGFELMTALEYEFVVCDKETWRPVYNGKDFAANRAFNYFGLLPYDIDTHLAKAGVDLQELHFEHAPSQLEFTLKPLKGIQAADVAFVYKNAVKEIVENSGYIASFMSRPFRDGLGNSSHFNHSLWHLDGHSAFYDREGKDGLTDLAYYWLGGIIKHARALTALFSPTVNCYRRLLGGFTPKQADWDIENRAVSLRVKNDSPKDTYIENRMPGGSANPYLVLAATVAAGIDGIKNQIPAPAKQEKDAVKFPETLEEALDALKSDNVIKEALGHEFVNWFCLVKETVEIKKLKQFDVRKQDEEAYKVERHMYFEML